MVVLLSKEPFAVAFGKKRWRRGTSSTFANGRDQFCNFMLRSLSGHSPIVHHCRQNFMHFVSHKVKICFTQCNIFSCLIKINNNHSSWDVGLQQPEHEMLNCSTLRIIISSANGKKGKKNKFCEWTSAMARSDQVNHFRAVRPCK